jgi:hypothetical protein
MQIMFEPHTLCADDSVQPLSIYSDSVAGMSRANPCHAFASSNRMCCRKMLVSDFILLLQEYPRFRASEPA